MRRRDFLIGSAVAVGGLAVGYRTWSGSFDAHAAKIAGEGGTLLGGWVKIGKGDAVTVYVPHIDMGQGTHTALAMMLAEELEADWSKVRTERAPADKAFANRFLAEGWILQGWTPPAFLDGAVDTVFAEAARFINLQVTGGSTAVRFTGQVGMRLVGATAKAMLLQAASQRWRVPATELKASESVISHPASGRSARYGELAEEAAGISVPVNQPLKSRADYKIVGRSVPRLDIPAKVTGKAPYGIDLVLPDMLYATIMAAPVHGGKLVSVDPAPAMTFRGVARVLKQESAVAVVADSYWQARRALDALKPVFSGDSGTSSKSHFEALDRLLVEGRGSSMHRAGDVEAAFKVAPANRIASARYSVPFLHHAAMEPINVTAQMKGERLEVWAGEQDALGSKAALARATGMTPGDITLHALPVGGAFGRRIAQTSHHLQQAADIAKAMSPRPVKLIWSREEDFAQGAYRPAVCTQIRAALGADGLPVAWRQIYANLPGPGRREGFLLPYAIPNQEMVAVEGQTHVRTGTWRSVAQTQHAFYTESFIDELATLAGRDPFEYRRDLLPAGSRFRKVLETAAQKGDWGSKLAAGRGRGIALAESYGSIVAHVIEVSATSGGFRVERVTAAVDCGNVCHPDNATAQVEGAIVMGLSSAREAITIERGAVVQKNFPDYPLLTLSETPPRIDVHFVASDGPWGGLGEPGLPPVAPALANALFAASGERVRTLPLTQGLRA